MCASELAVEKYKKVCEDFPYLAILTKSSIPGETQLTFGYAIVGKKSLGESVLAFALTGDLRSPTVVSIKVDIDFSVDVNKICLPVAEVLLCASASNLTHSKKQLYWMTRNTVLLPPVLMEAAIIYGELDAGKLMKIFARSIKEWSKEGKTSSGEDNNDNEAAKTA